LYGPTANKKEPDYKIKLKQVEDGLVDYFLYEMRKAPVEEKERQIMPIR